jgi:lipopolysaccharide export system permease protein
MAKRYLSWLYIKHFVVVLSILELFFLLIDFLQNQKNLPESANLIVLFLYFESVAALKITLPLSLIFGALSLFVYLVRTNEVIALLSFGYTKKQIINPIFVLSFVVALFFVFLNSTSVGYFYENGQALLKNRDRSSSTENLFFKFDDKYIYMQKLNPLTQEAFGVKLFTLDKDGSVTSIIDTQKAKYSNNGWHLESAKVVHVPKGMELSSNSLGVENNMAITTLNGFKPKVIDSVSNLNAALNIFDMIEALFILKNQDIDTERISQLLYATVLIPLMAPLAIIVIFSFLPISARFLDISAFASSTIFAVLGGFGLVSAISKAKFENMHFSLAMLFFTLILSIYSLKRYKKIAQ